MKPKIRRIKIRGRVWRIVMGRPPVNKCEGYCVPDERTIYIRSTAKSSQTVILMHEIIHACMPDLDERAVEEIEDALRAGLELIFGELP